MNIKTLCENFEVSLFCKSLPGVQKIKTWQKAGGKKILGLELKYVEDGKWDALEQESEKIFTETFPEEGAQYFHRWKITNCCELNADFAILSQNMKLQGYELLIDAQVVTNILVKKIILNSYKPLNWVITTDLYESEWLDKIDKYGYEHLLVEFTTDGQTYVVDCTLSQLIDGALKHERKPIQKSDYLEMLKPFVLQMEEPKDKSELRASYTFPPRLGYLNKFMNNKDNVT